MGVSELRKLRQLEEENQQQKKLVADLSLDKQMLKDVIKKSYKTLVQKGNGIVAGWPISNIANQGVQMCFTCSFYVLL